VYPRGTYPRTEQHKQITSAGLKKFYADGGKVWSEGKKFSDTHRAQVRKPQEVLYGN